MATEAKMFITFYKTRKKKEVLCTFPDPSPNPSPNANPQPFHLVNEPLQTVTLQYGLIYLTDSSATEYKYSIGCATDYKPETVSNQVNLDYTFFSDSSVSCTSEFGLDIVNLSGCIMV